MITWTTNEADYPDHSFLYVSKLGSDANAGTKAAPLLTINAAIAIAEADAGYVTELIAIVIGEGIWGDALTNRTKRYKFIGSGAAKFDGTTARVNMYPTEHLIDLEFFNFNDTINWFNSAYLINTNYYFTRIKADYIYIAHRTQGNNLFLVSCVIGTFHYRRISYDVFKFSAINCLFNNIYLLFSGAIQHGFGPFYNNIVLGRVVAVTNVPLIPVFDHNNFVGNELFLTTSYTIDGPFEPLLSNPQFNTATINPNSFSSDPEFNNETLGDYSLKETSPCLLAGLNRASIGVYNRGWPHYSFTDIFRSISGAVYSESYIGATLERDIVTDLELGEFELESGHNTGTVVSAVGNLGAPQRIDRIESLIDFGTDVSGYHTTLPVWSDFLFAAYNNARKYFEGDTITEGGTKYICILDYPNENPFVEYPPASSPTYWAVSAIPTATNVVPNFLFRYGNSLAEINASDWKLMPFKGDFKVDENGKGSADPDYDAATGRYITFSRYQFKLKLKNL